MKPWQQLNATLCNQIPPHFDSERARSPLLSLSVPSEAEETVRRAEVGALSTGQLTSLWYQTCCCCAPLMDFFLKITPDDILELSHQSH